MLFRSNDTATTEIYTTHNTLSLHDALPIFDIIPWSVIILAAVLAAAIWFSTRPFGRSLVAVGDNVTAARYAGVRVWWVKTSAFIISSVSATISGVLLVGYAGVHPKVGLGYEFIAITAVVLGGVVLGGGRGLGGPEIGRAHV